MKSFLNFFLLFAMLLSSTSTIANMPFVQSDNMAVSRSNPDDSDWANSQQVENLAQIQDVNSIQLFLQINETKLKPGETIYLNWKVEGQDIDWKNNQYMLEICIPAEVKPVGDTEKDFNFGNGCWNKELEEFIGELIFKTTNEYFGGMMISAVLYNEKEKVAENSVEFEVKQSETSDPKIELRVDRKAILAKDKTQITTFLQVEGFDPTLSNQQLTLEICLLNAIQAVEESIIGMKDDESGCYRMPVEQAEIHLDWILNKEVSLESTAIQYALYVGDVFIGYQMVDIFLEANGVVTNNQESQITDKSGRMMVNFPQKAASRNLDITIKSDLENTKSIAGTPVHLYAFDAESGEEVKQFDGEVAIEISYTGTEVEEDPDLYTWKYFHEGSQLWVNVPSEIDYENKIIRGWTNHFSDFVISASQIFISQIPALTTADVSEFSGGASYQIPIQVPQGPGGFTPSISLDYNSQVADSVSSYTQSSVVGLGWDLNTGGVISRNNHVSSFDRDDTFNLRLGNISYELIPVGKASNYIDYVTITNSFIKIRKYTNNCTGYDRMGYWVLWDKTGKKYTFESLEIFDQRDVACGEAWKKHAYAWHLTEIRDPSGQIMKYIYNKYYFSGGTRTREFNLEDIIYPDNHTRIHFVNEEGRHDYLWTWWDAGIPHNRRSLNQIQTIFDPLIEYDSSGKVISHGNETIISYYQLNYFDNTNNPIFPLFKWEYEENNKTGTYLALSDVVYKGKNSGEFSKVSFLYEDHMHLTEINNHNGGNVTFEYESTPWHDTLNVIDYQATEPVNYDNLLIRDYRFIGQSDVGGYSLNYPGQYVRVFCSLAEINGDDTFQLFMSNTKTIGNVDFQNIPTVNIGDPNSWSDYLDNDGPYNATVEAYLFWKPDLAKAKMYVGIDSLTGLNQHINKCYIDRMVTRYRVVSRTISDDVADSSSQKTYQYTSPKTNENNGEEISWILTQSPRQIKQEKEFRGHSSTSFIDSYRNLRTDFYFYQTDDLQGLPWKIELYDISNGQNKKISETEMHYLTTRLRGYDNISACAYDGTGNCYEDNLTYYWVRKDWETHKTFTSDGSNFLGSKHAYGYDEYGNVNGTISYEWNGSNWIVKINNVTGYEPNNDLANDTYLVDLPTYASSYGCPGGTCSTDITNLLKFTCSLYDPATGSPTICGINSDGSVTEIKPANGLIKGSRTLLSFENDNYATPQYQDNLLTYDSWGNIASTTSFSGFGTNSSLASIGARSVVSTYDNLFHARLIRQAAPLDGIINQLSIYHYDPNDNCYWFGRPSSVIDPNGHETTAACDEFGRLTEVRQPGDEIGLPTTSVEYIPYQAETIPGQKNPTNIRITTKINTSQSQTISYYSNGLGNIVQTQQLDAILEGSVHKDLVQTVLFDDVGRQILSEVGNHAINSGDGYDENLPTYLIQTEYDNQDRVTVVSNPDGTQTTYDYEIIYYSASDLIEDQYALKQTTVDPNGHAQYQYTNVFGQMIESDANAGDQKTQYGYDLTGNLINVFQPKIENPLSPQDWVETSINYDIGGRKIDMDDPDMGFWSYGYDALGNLLMQTDARNVTSTISYDLANRVTAKTFSSQSSVVQTDPISYNYDGSSMLETFSGTSLPDSFIITGSANVSFNAESMIFTGNGTWDSVIRSASSISGGESVSFLFKRNSNNGQANAFIDTGTYGQSSYRRYSFEILNGIFQRKTYTGTTIDTTSMMTFNPNTWYMGILGVGQDGVFRVIIWERDNPSVMISLSDTMDSSWKNLNWTFRLQNTNDELQVDNYRELDHLGYRSEMIDGSGSTNWAYDNRGRIIKENKFVDGIGGSDFLAQWAYNSAGLLESMTYPGGDTGQAGEVLNYTYNQRSLLETMTGTNNYITASQYDTSGRLLERYLNNSTLKATRSYYGWDTFGGRLHTIQSGTIAAPSSIQNLTYQDFDNNGNILRLDNPYEKTSGGTQVSTRTLYEYDDLDRLIQAQMKFITSETQYYLQDYDYDDLGRLEAKGGTSLTYSEPNGKLHAVSAAGSVTYQYDANGNMTARNTGVPSTSFEFSYDSENRLRTASSSNTNVSFVYDGDGSRILTTQTVVSTTTTTITIGGYYEWVSSSNWTKYYFAGPERIAYATYGNFMTYMFNDHLGSTVAIYNHLGYTYRNVYYPFGEERYSTSSTPYQYTGQRKESAIGLYDYHARFFDPNLGHFIQPDTIVPGPGSPQSWDRYAYVNNHPIKYSRPSGNYFCGDDCTHHTPISYTANDIYNTKLLEYGVSILGDWSTKELSTIYAAIRGIGSKFYSYSSFINGSPSSIFRAVFRNGVSVRKSTTAGGFCEASGAGFSCLSNISLDTGLVIHELGHTFNATFVNKNIDGLSPYNLLAKSSLFTSDHKFVTGLHRVLSPDGNEYETKWDRTFLGYVDSVPPYAYHGTRWNDWNSVGEEFADMFANWIKGSFSVDEAGNIRNIFMQAYMGTYIYQFSNN